MGLAARRRREIGQPQAAHFLQQLLIGPLSLQPCSPARRGRRVGRSHPFPPRHDTTSVRVEIPASEPAGRGGWRIRGVLIDRSERQLIELGQSR